jgi:hypothetical protein
MAIGLRRLGFQAGSRAGYRRLNQGVIDLTQGRRRLRVGHRHPGGQDMSHRLMLILAAAALAVVLIIVLRQHGAI